VNKPTFPLTINKGRMKRKSRTPTKFEKFHMDRIGDMGCLICEMPTNIHHLLRCPWARIKRQHDAVVPLCWDHHQGQGGVHDHGDERLFFELWGWLSDKRNVYAWALEERNESARLFND